MEPSTIPEFHVQERLRGATIVHHVDEQGRVYLSHGRRIFRSDQGTRSHLATFPAVYPRDLFSFHRLAQRAARADKCNVYVNRQGNILAIRAETVYSLKNGELKSLGPIQGDSVLHDSFSEDHAGWTYFGEYFRNPDRGPVRIWRVDADLTQMEIAHEFPAGQIRHVHGVYQDRHDPSALWVSVGDLKNECYLIRTDDRFKTMKWFGDGTQKWRAVKLFFTPTHVTWITDSNLEQNYACRMDRRTGQIELGSTIDCSGWYGFQTKSGHYVAGTTVELGPGILSNYSSLLVSSDGFHWQVARRFRKDMYRPMRIFKYGVLNFPSGEFELDDFYVSGEGLAGIDGRVLRVSVKVAANHAKNRESADGSSVLLDRNGSSAASSARPAA